MGSRRPSAPVLIVEDNYETREVLERILELWGYATATAEDGLAALGYLRGGNPACLIILDLRMPIMDGWALSRELQADPKFAGRVLSEHRRRLPRRRRHDSEGGGRSRRDAQHH